MGNIFYIVYTLIYVCLIIYSYRLTSTKDLQYKFYLAILVALFCDCLISGIGFLLGEGHLLKLLNFFRYASHVFITPLLCYVIFKLAQKMQVKIAQSKAAEVVVWALIVVFIIWGFLHDIAPMDLKPSVAWGVLIYGHAEPSVPLPVIVINIFVIISSCFIWKTTGWPGLFITSIAMLFIGAIQIKGLGQIPGNAGEILFMCGFLLAQRRALNLNCYYE